MRHDASARHRQAAAGTFPEDPVSQVRPTKRTLALDPDDDVRSTLLPPPMPRAPAPAAAPARAVAAPPTTDATVERTPRLQWADVVRGAAWALVAVSVAVVVFALAH